MGEFGDAIESIYRVQSHLLKIDFWLTRVDFSRRRFEGKTLVPIDARCKNIKIDLYFIRFWAS